MAYFYPTVEVFRQTVTRKGRSSLGPTEYEAEESIFTISYRFEREGLNDTSRVNADGNTTYVVNYMDEIPLKIKDVTSYIYDAHPGWFRSMGYIPENVAKHWLESIGFDIKLNTTNKVLIVVDIDYNGRFATGLYSHDGNWQIIRLMTNHHLEVCNILPNKKEE